MTDEKQKVTHIKITVDMVPILKHIDDCYEKFTSGLPGIIEKMVYEMKIPPEARTRVGEVILARAMLTYADSAVSGVEWAKEVLAGTHEADGRVH